MPVPPWLVTSTGWHIHPTNRTRLSVPRLALLTLPPQHFRHRQRVPQATQNLGFRRTTAKSPGVRVARPPTAGAGSMPPEPLACPPPGTVGGTLSVQHPPPRPAVPVQVRRQTTPQLTPHWKRPSPVVVDPQPTSFDVQPACPIFRNTPHFGRPPV